MARRGYTQQVVADALGIDQARVSDRLNGKTKISADELAKLAGLFGVSADWLLEDQTQQAAS